MIDLTTSESSIQRGIHRPAATVAVIALALGLALIPSSRAQAEWESDYHTTSTYWGLVGSLAIPNFSDRIGQAGHRPYDGVMNATNGGGLRVFFGYRVHPYAAFEVAFDWLTGLGFTSTSTAGKQDIGVLKGSIIFKVYPLAKPLDTVLDGRLQPYVYLAPGVAGATSSNLKTPIHFNIGIGGGVEYWLNDTWTVHTEAQYAVSFGTIKDLDYTTVSAGAAYHF